MNSVLAQARLLCSALALSNFLYQAATARSWEVALERSTFQAVAVAALAFQIWMAR